MKPQELPLDTRLIQLAEESAELAQASLKVIRAMNGDTPVSVDDAIAHLIEEVADVSVCMGVIDDIAPITDVCKIIARKVERWEERLDAQE